jgi:hypothetical protein
MKPQRHPNSPYVKGVRPMVRGDIEALRQPSSRPRVSKLRDSHYQMIRMFAAGLTNAEVAGQMGYTIARVSLLRNSPAIREQVDRFHAHADDTAKEAMDSIVRMQTEIAAKGLRTTLDKIEDGELSDSLVLKAVDSALDRIGYHRKSTKENVNINFAARIEQAWVASRQVKLINGD